MSYDCMYDCIHLHACRRVQYIARRCNIVTPRYCTEDCNCYVSGDKSEYITVEEAIDYARAGTDAILAGRDAKRVYAPEDMDGATLGRLIDDLEAQNENS